MHFWASWENVEHISNRFPLWWNLTNGKFGNYQKSPSKSRNCTSGSDNLFEVPKGIGPLCHTCHNSLGATRPAVFSSDSSRVYECGWKNAIKRTIPQENHHKYCVGGMVTIPRNMGATLWLCQNSYWSHGPIEIVSFPINSMVDLSIVFCMSLPEAKHDIGLATAKKPMANVPYVPSNSHHRIAFGIGRWPTAATEPQRSQWRPPEASGLG